MKTTYFISASLPVDVPDDRLFARRVQALADFLAGVLHVAVCLHRGPEEDCPDDPACRRRRRAGAAGGPAGRSGAGGEPGTVRLAQPLAVQGVRKLGGGGVHDFLLQVIAAAAGGRSHWQRTGRRRMDSGVRPQWNRFER
jgi:hypothetical protein